MMSDDASSAAGGAGRSVALPAVEVIEPGLLTTVQDGGRQGAGFLGVPEGGAADRRSLAVANLLAGNARDAAALECTLVGPVLRVLRPLLIGIAGADLDAHIVETGGRIEAGTSAPLRPGSTVSLAGPARVGARAYLAVGGGFEVEAVLGSRATALGPGFGGYHGRALRSGDVLSSPPDARLGPPARWPAAIALPRPGAVGGPGGSTPGVVVRIVPGPQASGPDDPRLAGLTGMTWRVSLDSDRMGLRLEGPSIGNPGEGDIPSLPVVPGAIQLPPDGRPIVLLVDAQPTGGYRVPATVITADVPRLGQLRPGDDLRFEVVTIPTARAILRRDLEVFEAAAADLIEAEGWDALWLSAEG
jgi:biotin-dependent carboxylase-like uncharacterized protein